MHVTAIVLTHRPDPAILQEGVRLLVPQVDQVLFVDNGTPWDPAAVLAELSEDARARVDFLWLERNLGVGAGHNRGIRWARAHGSSHVLILDQDSVPAPAMVSRLSGALDTLTGRGIPVAAVGPRWRDRHTGRLSEFVRLGLWAVKRVPCVRSHGDVLETDFTMSSGALIPMAALDAVGEMDEGFFIDHVDTEWVFRARARGYRSFGVCDAIMEHSLGTATLRLWFGRWRNVALHRPERHYYVFRNSILLLHRPHAPRRWFLIDVIRLTSMAALFPVLGPRRVDTVRLMARGIKDGLRGVTGPLE